MTARVFAPHGSAPQRSPHAASSKRLAAAVVASALAHLVAAGLNGGGASRASNAVLPQTVTVRLVPAAPHAAEAEPLPATPVPSTLTQSEPQPPPLSTPRPVRLTAAERRAGKRESAEASSTGAAVAETPDLTYYGAKQLDVYPTLAAPLQLAAPGLSGRALLIVLIDATGAVNHVSFAEATPAAIPEEDAHRAFLSARFTPAYRNGRAVRSRMLVELSYGEGRRDP